MVLVLTLEVGIEARKGRGGDGLALTGDYILRRVELSEVIAKQERADGGCEESVGEVGRETA